MVVVGRLNLFRCVLTRLLVILRRVRLSVFIGLLILIVWRRSAACVNRRCGKCLMKVTLANRSKDPSGIENSSRRYLEQVDGLA